MFPAIDDTIAAPATAAGGALSIVRISGPDALEVCDGIFRSPSGKRLTDQVGNTILFGNIVAPGSPFTARPLTEHVSEPGGAELGHDGTSRFVDEVLVSVFRAPHSYTGQDMAEISCHGSPYITSTIMQLLIDSGARAAEAGEFTVRAMLSGKLDLSQAEAVADMIASVDHATHSIAATQMRGGYSMELKELRGELLRLLSLLELELDFSEEDVTFADRGELSLLVERVESHIAALVESFSLGNALKEGVAVAVAGAPNAGKSTLLNALVREERAIVSEIAGTTRDTVEERVTIAGVQFRLTDTAGIRHSDDRLEQLGIERTFSALARARIVLYLFDIHSLGGGTPEIISETRNASKAPEQAESPKPYETAEVTEATEVIETAVAVATAAMATAAEHIKRALAAAGVSGEQHIAVVLNKCDGGKDGLTAELSGSSYARAWSGDGGEDKFIAALAERLPYRVIAISAKHGRNIDALRDFLAEMVDADPAYNGATIVSNIRHYEALTKALEALGLVRAGLTDGLPADLLAEELRACATHLGAILGEISSTDILTEIFSKFCIGK